MLVKTIEDKENGKKWEIYKNQKNNYSYKYYEYFSNDGWILTGTEENYSKVAIEYELDTTI